MSAVPPIRAVLFDSGDTLVHPAEGKWWPDPGVVDLLARCPNSQGLEARLPAALDLGMAYLDDNHHVETLAQERAQFLHYYAIVLDALDEGLATEEQLDALVDTHMVCASLVPYPETVPVLEALRARSLTLGILSNAWPSLEAFYEAQGWRGYFDAFVVSSRVGCCKPDAHIYECALQGLGVPPDQVLFVDDWSEYVAKAIELGMHGAVMQRNNVPEPTTMPTLRTLWDVLDLLPS